MSLRFLLYSNTLHISHLQKDERLLVNDNKERVKEFRNLGKTKELNPDTRDTRSVRVFRIVTENIVHGIMRKVVNELCTCTDEPNRTKQTQG